jgi:predicted nucleotidyltransferase
MPGFLGLLAAADQTGAGSVPFAGVERPGEVQRMTRSNTIAQDRLDRVIQRIVEVAKPDKIILFGSAARGAMGPHSDVDLLVVKAGANRLDLMGEIYRALHGVGVPVDVIVATPEDVERYRDSHALVIAPALKEGRVVYAA